MSRSSTLPKPKPIRRECDLSPPIQAYLTAQGYTVRSEVNNCDITAMRGDDLIVVELKKQFSTDLLIQATTRQRVADSVYVALPIEGPLERRERASKRWRGIEYLLKRLELGLILVEFPTDPDAPPMVEVVQHPIVEARPRRRPKVRQNIIREISGRQAGDYNVGGVTKRAILTAYREQCIFIACCLDRFGSQSPVALRARGSGPKTQNMLFTNVYGWFERLDRGLYALRPAAKDEIAITYPGVAAFYNQKLDDASPAADSADSEAAACYNVPDGS